MWECLREPLQEEDRRHVTHCMPVFATHEPGPMNESLQMLGENIARHIWPSNKVCANCISATQGGIIQRESSSNIHITSRHCEKGRASSQDAKYRYTELKVICARLTPFLSSHSPCLGECSLPISFDTHKSHWN